MNCQVCSAPIPSSRLAAIPGARLCVRCVGEPYTRPTPRTAIAGHLKLLETLTEAPVVKLADPERHAQERAEASIYRQIEELDEIIT